MVKDLRQRPNTAEHLRVTRINTRLVEGEKLTLTAGESHLNLGLTPGGWRTERRRRPGHRHTVTDKACGPGSSGATGRAALQHVSPRCQAEGCLTHKVPSAAESSRSPPGASSSSSAFY